MPINNSTNTLEVGHPPDQALETGDVKNDKFISTGGQIGNYKIQSVIGKGGFGSVYRANHENLDVAIKLLRGNFPEREREKILREARLLEQLNHHHILPVLDVGISEDGAYLVTPYASEGSLRDLLRKRREPKDLPVKDALEILEQVGEALEYVHEHRIIHRDVKPENILFDSKGEVLLADFGIASVITQEEKTTEIVGTPRYMAPEQFQGEVTKKSDQYALGCVAYELLTGRVPFAGSDLSQIRYKHMHEEPPPLREFVPSISPRIEEAILRALAKDPRERFNSVLDFVVALEAATQGDQLVSIPSVPSVYQKEADQGDQLVSIPVFQLEPPRAFLDEVYRALDYQNGTLLDAIDSPDSTMDEEIWLEKGDWLALAHKAGAEKVLFVNNDPVIVFCEINHILNDNELLELFKRFWCMSRPLFLFIASLGELRVYRLDQPPTRETKVLREKRQIVLVEHVVEVAERLQAYRREEVESGRLLSDERFGGIDQRADRQLIQDLKMVRKQLLATGLEAKYAHALIGRSIFIRYLEDRGVIDSVYFEKIAQRNLRWQAMLLQKPAQPVLALDSEKRRYYRVLLDKDFTYALFQQLADDFNGDMFPKDETEERMVNNTHLKLLHGFLLGDTNPTQPHLFLWAYDFEIIPIELISSIYEEFYHKENTYRPGKNRVSGRQDDVKTHYTPSVLVEYILTNILSTEVLAQKPKILDPACGSGIFLVEAFRRIVRYHVQQNNGKTVSPDMLRRILREQVRGIEINEEAVHVAAFSLYLALLHYQEPPDIRTKRLPHLIYQEGQLEDDYHYHVLFHKNAFALVEEEREQIGRKLTIPSRYKGRIEHERLYHTSAKLPLCLHSFDVITGNPPWGFERGATQEIREAQDLARRWSFYFDWSIGDDEPAQTFIARALSLLKPDGECGLLVPTGVFLKHHKNSREFRHRWLEDTTIRSVVNFTHVRHAFFNMNANAPFAFVHFTAKPDPLDHWIRYWSVKKTEVVDKIQAIVLGQPDIRRVKQFDLLSHDFLWKVYWWGNHRDAALIMALRLNKTLDGLAQMRGWPRPGRGFEVANGHQPSGWLQQYQVLPSKHFTRYGPINPHVLEVAPDYVYRRGNSTIQKGWRLLIGQGITEAYGANGRVEARLEDQPYAFNSSIHGLNVDDAEDWERKVLIGILWSSLARYYYFMTVSSWGMWHHQLHLEEAMSLPVRFPRDPDLRDAIVNVVNALMSWSESQQEDSLLSQNPFTLQKQLALLERQLDDAIFKLYELSEAERDLVLDLCEVNLEFFYRHYQSNAARVLEPYPRTSQGTISNLPEQRVDEQGLEGYLKAFLQIWNRELAPEGEFSWRILRPAGVPMIAVIFATQEVGDALPSHTSTDDEEWHEVLRRCDATLQQPVSRNIYIDSMVRAVTDTEIYIIKRDERRLWTRSMAREDAEATLVQTMYLQEKYMRETV